ncbi:MAG: NAD(P)/FAD-dependent oxidoreductase [Balneolaceae bacterium]|nr:NAD(P)/FAD-dependent oxidoreductase [Balneolaceae bacterium]
MLDAVIIGAGPNGLAAAITLAQRGLEVKVYEAKDTIGGGTRTQELTLPGFKHDVCSAIHPMAVASPFFQSLPLEEHGLQWIHPEYPLAHPLDNGEVVVLYESLEKMVDSLGADGMKYHRLMEPIVQNWNSLSKQILGPISLLPSSPIIMARFGLQAFKSAERLALNKFDNKETQALFAGLAAHSILPLSKPTTAAIGLVLGAVAHHIGWPFPKGGSHSITKAMASYFKSLGGEIETNRLITSIDELPKAKAIFFNTTPAQVLDIAGDSVPYSYAHKLNGFRYGSGAFKLDLALEEPVPWINPSCHKAATIHLGGTFEEIAQSEKAVANGKHPGKPYVLVAQQSLFDETRAPKGKHTIWAYCHVPHGSTKDMRKPILNQIERFAPGFKDLIIGQHSMNTQDLQNYNANYIGGDINGGAQDLSQLFSRPVNMFNPYHIPQTNMYISSSSTPPGGGVHGMCGYHAAQSAIKDLFS